MHVLRHLQNHELAKALYPVEVILEGSHIGHNVEDIVILEDVGGRVGVGARAVQDHRADALVTPRGIEDEVVNFLFAAHKPVLLSYTQKRKNTGVHDTRRPSIQWVWQGCRLQPNGYECYSCTATFLANDKLTSADGRRGSCLRKNRDPFVSKRSAGKVFIVRCYAVKWKIGGVWAGIARPNTPLLPTTA